MAWVTGLRNSGFSILQQYHQFELLCVDRRASYPELVGAKDAHKTVNDSVCVVFRPIFDPSIGQGRQYRFF
jgi:hypothetical protein